MAFAVINRAEIVPRELEALVSHEEDGAICTFIGQVRNHARGKQVSFLEYSAYASMAQKQLLDIAESAEAKWPVKVAIQHRLGKLGIGEASVCVAVSSPHRAVTFEACHWCINTLKADVPVWKKETCPDGSFWIEGENQWVETGEEREKG